MIAIGQRTGMDAERIGRMTIAAYRELMFAAKEIARLEGNP